MALRIPRLESSIPIVNPDGTPAIVFIQWWDTVAKRIEASVGSIEDALEAAGIAQAAAEVAQAAAADAQAAGDGANSVASLTNSGVSGCTITATDAGTDVTISISGHTRIYGNGTNVAVTGASLTGRAYSTTYYVYYDQPSRAGGAVTYQTTTSEATAAQTGDRHLVGIVTTPAAAGAPIDGDYVRPPGVGGIEP